MIELMTRAGVIAAAMLLTLTVSQEGKHMDFRKDFEVDLAKYTGVWHEIGRTPNSFEDNNPRRNGKRLSACFNSKAEYAAAGEGVISVTNSCLRTAPDGTQITDTARGSARVIEGSKNRKLLVAFGPGIARFFQRLLSPGDGNYWIYCLGPEVEDRYSWAVIGDKRKSYIFLLARERAVPEDQKAEMINCAREAGLPVTKLIFPQKAE